MCSILKRRRKKERKKKKKTSICVVVVVAAVVPCKAGWSLHTLLTGTDAQRREQRQRRWIIPLNITPFGARKARSSPFGVSVLVFYKYSTGYTQYPARRSRRVARDIVHRA